MRLAPEDERDVIDRFTRERNLSPDCVQRVAVRSWLTGEVVVFYRSGSVLQCADYYLIPAVSA